MSGHMRLYDMCNYEYSNHNSKMKEIQRETNSRNNSQMYTTHTPYNDHCRKSLHIVQGYVKKFSVRENLCKKNQLSYFCSEKVKKEINKELWKFPFNFPISLLCLKYQTFCEFV